MPKGYDTLTLMIDKTASELIQNLLIKKLGWKPQNSLSGGIRDPFDITQPNIHENKADFLHELAAVNTVVENSKEIIDKLVKTNEEKTNQYIEMVDRLVPAINILGLKLLQNKVPSSASELAQKNTVETGFYWNSLVTILNMGSAYNERLIELKDQEKEFWSVNHRPPNYYARIIALRFARFYARHTKKKPTFGTSRDGPHPSTDYGRLLEEIFLILEIKSGLKNPAMYAIEQITPEDMKSRISSLRELNTLFNTNETVPTQGLYSYKPNNVEDTEK